MNLVALWPAFDEEDEDYDEFFGGAGPSGVPLAITYPTTLLGMRVQIALGADLSADPLTWSWVDITDRVRADLGVSLSTGRRDEASTVTPGSAQIKLDNRDGRFSRRNPTSPYFGLLSKNTPIWATLDAGSGHKTRLEMFVNEWPTRWADSISTDSTVTINCAGALRRLAQGSVLKSALRRAIAAAGPIAYWPLEDGFDAAFGASALPSGSVMEVTADTVDWAGATPPDGATAAPDLTNFGRLAGLVPASSATVYTVEFVANCALAATDVPLAFRMTGGAYPYFWFYTQIDGVIGGQFVGGTPLVFVDNFGNLPVLDDYDRKWHHYRVVVSEVAGSVSALLWVDGVASSGLPTTMTLGRISAVEVNSAVLGTSIDGSVIHVAVYDFAMMEDHSAAMLAYTGEMAHSRIARLSGEEGIVFQTLASTSAAMGPQYASTLLMLLRECEVADGGTLYEKRWGLAYKSLAEYYNQPAGLALDFNLGHISDLPEPADDDQRTRNRWTVSRDIGSEFTDEQTTGPMGTGTQGPGVYDDSISLNVEADSQLAQQASWRLHLGLVDEDRWPSIGLNFLAKPELIDTWTALGYGARVTVDHPPTQMPPDPLDLIVEGHTEWWDGIAWRASINTSPASPYRVAAVGSTVGNLGRVDAANSTLAADATSGATTISVASPVALWRTGAVNFDIAVGGERMTVTNISGASSPQVFTVTRSINGIVKALPAMTGTIPTKVSLWQPAVVAL